MFLYWEIVFSRTQPSIAASPRFMTTNISIAASPYIHDFPVWLQILEKSDYTSISGNSYIKKSGWRKISCFFNISFEIKDRSIEFDEDRNVKRAEFLVRASMLGGRFSDGWGSCDRREKRFNKPNHDIPSTAETRAKNKACQDLLGIGNNRPG